MKKFTFLAICLALSSNLCFADFREHYDAGQKYYLQYQYSSAITEFKKALRINYLDNSARTGLINSYLARGTYRANTEKNWDKASDDFRAALFYLKYFAPIQNSQNSYAAIQDSSNNLSICMKNAGFVTSPVSRYNRAMKLRTEGEFAGAGYEFIQASSNTQYKKDSLGNVGDIMNLLGNSQKAAEYYAQAVAFAPNDIDLRLKYARILEKIDKPDMAVAQYSAVLNKTNNNPEIFYELERIYARKIEENPKDAEAVANLGAIKQKQGKFDEALKYYSKAEYINPTNTTTRINVGTLYQAKKDYENALIAYNSVLDIQPDNLQVNILKAQCLMEMDRKVEALATYKKVLALDPTNTDAKSQLFGILKDTMTPNEMLNYLSTDSGVDTNSIVVMYDYALELHKKGQLDNAIKYYKEVIKQQPMHAEAYINLAIAFGQKKEYDKANTVLSIASKKFPNNKQISSTMKSINEGINIDKYSKAADYYNAENWQKALEEYSAVQPATLDSLLAIASCYQNLKNPNSAIENYKKALTLDPNNTEIAYYLGALYAEQENWVSAKNYLSKAKTNPKARELLDSVIEQNNAILLNKAIDLFEASNFTESLKILNQIVSEDNKNSYAYYYRGMIYDNDKKYSQAIEQYKKAVQLNSELGITYYLTALDYDNLTQYANAISYYQKYITNTQEENEYKTYAKSRIEELKKY